MATSVIEGALDLDFGERLQPQNRLWRIGPITSVMFTLLR